MKPSNLYEVKKPHVSNYPNPITLTKGDQVIIGVLYDKNPNWRNWIFCSTNDLISGWVPKQIVKIDGDKGTVLENYSARELNVHLGDRLVGIRELNGWLWVKKINSNEEGWTPKENLQSINPTFSDV